MKQQTAMQILWDWIDANCHEDNFNINDAREMSLKLEKEQIAKAWDGGNYQYFCSKITNEDFDNGEEYYKENYDK